MEQNNRPAIDRLDLRLLDILQRHGALSVAEVAAQTKLSTTTCWRRIQQLEQNGVIKARVALLDRNALGLDVTIFAHVKLATTGRDALAEFEAAIRDRAEVLECYTLTGEWDFLLKIVTKNIKAYEAFYLDYLSRIPVRAIGQFLSGSHRDQGIHRLTLEGFKAALTAAGRWRRWCVGLEIAVRLRRIAQCALADRYAA